VNHTAKHSVAVRKRCDEVGVAAVLKVGDGPGDPVTFLLEQLRKSK
jgi:hypothetical protein